MVLTLRNNLLILGSNQLGTSDMGGGPVIGCFLSGHVHAETTQGRRTASRLVQARGGETWGTQCAHSEKQDGGSLFY